MTDIITEGPVKAIIPAQKVELSAKSASPLAPNTTEQQDLTTAGQRKVNLIWEYTQAIIAMVVVTTTMASTLIASWKADTQVPNLIAVAFGTVVGFYFSRTNHAAIGGVGDKPSQPYEGR